jgi:hypothetical protein
VTHSPHQRPEACVSTQMKTIGGGNEQNAYSEHGAVGIGVCGVDELLKVARRILPELSF